jgi:hypothetical protein
MKVDHLMEYDIWVTRFRRVLPPAGNRKHTLLQFYGTTRKDEASLIGSSKFRHIGGRQHTVRSDDIADIT